MILELKDTGGQRIMVNITRINYIKPNADNTEFELQLGDSKFTIDKAMFMYMKYKPKYDMRIVGFDKGFYNTSCQDYAKTATDFPSADLEVLDITKKTYSMSILDTNTIEMNYNGGTPVFTVVNPALVSISAEGVITPLERGSTEVIITLGELTETIKVQVQPEVMSVEFEEKEYNIKGDTEIVIPYKLIDDITKEPYSKTTKPQLSLIPLRRSYNLEIKEITDTEVIIKVTDPTIVSEYSLVYSIKDTVVRTNISYRPASSITISEENRSIVGSEDTFMVVPAEFTAPSDIKDISYDEDKLTKLNYNEFYVKPKEGERRDVEEIVDITYTLSDDSTETVSVTIPISGVFTLSQTFTNIKKDTVGVVKILRDGQPTDLDIDFGFKVTDDDKALATTDMPGELYIAGLEGTTNSVIVEGKYFNQNLRLNVNVVDTEAESTIVTIGDIDINNISLEGYVSNLFVFPTSIDVEA